MVLIWFAWDKLFGKSVDIFFEELVLVFQVVNDSVLKDSLLNWCWLSLTIKFLSLRWKVKVIERIILLVNWGVINFLYWFLFTLIVIFDSSLLINILQINELIVLTFRVGPFLLSFYFHFQLLVVFSAFLNIANLLQHLFKLLIISQLNHLQFVHFLLHCLLILDFFLIHPLVIELVKILCYRVNERCLNRNRLNSHLFMKLRRNICILLDRLTELRVVRKFIVWFLMNFR